MPFLLKMAIALKPDKAFGKEEQRRDSALPNPSERQYPYY